MLQKDEDHFITSEKKIKQNKKIKRCDQAGIKLQGVDLVSKPLHFCQ